MDIANLVTRLQASGMTQSQIADAVGCTQPTISDLANGKIGKSRPSYKIVEGLIALAKKRGLRSDERMAGNRRHTDKKQ